MLVLVWELGWPHRWGVLTPSPQRSPPFLRVPVCAEFKQEQAGLTTKACLRLSGFCRHRTFQPCSIRVRRSLPSRTEQTRFPESGSEVLQMPVPGHDGARHAHEYDKNVYISTGPRDRSMEASGATPTLNHLRPPWTGVTTKPSPTSSPISALSKQSPSRDGFSSVGRRRINSGQGQGLRKSSMRRGLLPIHSPHHLARVTPTLGGWTSSKSR
ncbi:hypothetical protein B0I35DRAFT_211544 [Stachybotrys elegans]|uniref:Uncharacterized protein n=1 Tax=Stachybotrys elegans TaxID=80388 RepID=A0A8K0SQN5_9HYPO|nr:hypothetical protein B0I35DRAFT_211544 [Stachybotrys elegans]